MSVTATEVEILLADLQKASGQGMLSVPFGEPADASEVSDFVTFGVTNPGDPFSLGWSITVAENSEARIASAFVTGAITYEAGFGDPGALILTNADALGSFVRQSELPDWFPFPDYVAYRNIDETQTDLLIRDYLEANSNITEAIYASTGLITVDEVVSAFLAGALSTGIPVSAGQPIGVAAASGGARRLDIYMQTESGAINGLYLDPAIYHTHMEGFFTNLSGHVLIDSLQKVFAGPAANGVVRYVGAGGGASGDFTDPTSPADLVSTALAVCNPYDVIVIVDNGTYVNSEAFAPGHPEQSGELVVSKPITITSLSADVAIEQTAPAFPILTGAGGRRIILIDEVSDGIVTLNSLSITNGNATIGGSSPKSGGGILIDHSHQTYIRNCYIYSNRTSEQGGDYGLGGGVHAHHSSAYIYRNRVSNNISIDRGGGIGTYGYGWPVVEGNLISENQASGGGRPDGGGVMAEVALPESEDFSTDLEGQWNADDLSAAKTRRIIFKRNTITGNSAQDDGGGVYLSVLAQASFIENEIAFNTAEGGGGGVRATLGAHVRMSGDHIYNNTANLSHGESSGGGVSSRDVSLLLSNVTIEGNVVEGFAGGGLSFSTADEGDFTFLPVDWNSVLRDVFDVVQANLELLGATSITNNHCTMIEGEADHRIGGGIYILRYKYEGLTDAQDWEAIPLTVVIENFSAISGNHIDKVIGPSQWYVDPSGVTHLHSKDFHLEDMVARPNNPVDASNNQNFIVGVQFVYP
jgi:hypothetical protein